MIETLTTLGDAYSGSWYTIAGVGGDPQKWVDGYTDLLAQADIGKPARWLQVTGAQVNEFAGEGVAARSLFDPALTLLLFPLDGLHVGRLALFKLRMGDRWLDDVIDNMRADRLAVS